MTSLEVTTLAARIVMSLEAVVLRRLTVAEAVVLRRLTVAEAVALALRMLMSAETALQTVTAT